MKIRILDLEDAGLLAIASFWKGSETTRDQECGLSVSSSRSEGMSAREEFE
ncbi:hypothetical protein J4G43_038620 [Bradyrhizobium barranii subsp. barranii]|uniref:Uncharacterized protein n=1 Tax=Bradyrhizobium barranii subsp. barranii TaxID=2823807 RepID=A0A939MFS2_9BRAD|nr:hypothetical protein [Bradyrhizobium barranii]UEM10521.1 hypothetical protein J4G43_038620 [Bradyrhizobium barranii subsp. barranii]